MTLVQRGLCDACRSASATFEIEAAFLVCDNCHQVIEHFVLNKVSLGSHLGVRAAAIEIAPPTPAVAAATNSEVPGGWSPPNRQASVATSQPVSRAVAAPAELAALISALEVGWLMEKNASTFLTDATNSIPPASSLFA